MGLEYKILYVSEVARDLEDIDTSLCVPIQKAIAAKLATNPGVYGKPLRFPLASYWSLHVGSHRVVFQILATRVIVFAILHRSIVYEVMKQRLGL